MMPTSLAATNSPDLSPSIPTIYSPRKQPDSIAPSQNKSPQDISIVVSPRKTRISPSKTNYFSPAKSKLRNAVINPAFVAESRAKRKREDELIGFRAIGDHGRTKLQQMLTTTGITIRPRNKIQQRRSANGNDVKIGAHLSQAGMRSEDADGKDIEKTRLTPEATSSDDDDQHLTNPIDGYGNLEERMHIVLSSADTAVTPATPAANEAIDVHDKTRKDGTVPLSTERSANNDTWVTPISTVPVYAPSQLIPGDTIPVYAPSQQLETERQHLDRQKNEFEMATNNDIPSSPIQLAVPRNVKFASVSASSTDSASASSIPESENHDFSDDDARNHEDQDERSCLSGGEISASGPAPLPTPLLKFNVSSSVFTLDASSSSGMYTLELFHLDDPSNSFKQF